MYIFDTYDIFNLTFLHVFFLIIAVLLLYEFFLIVALISHAQDQNFYIKGTLIDITLTLEQVWCYDGGNNAVFECHSLFPVTFSSEMNQK